MTDPVPTVPPVAGVVLAAGAGRRYGTPKGLLRHPDGEPWVARAAAVLRDGGCDPVLVVVGAAADGVRELVPAWARVVHAADWHDGMGASLRAGLAAVAGVGGAGAAVVALVDTPGVTADVVRRLLTAARAGEEAGPDGVLVRAGYRGAPGHPVLIGRAHWPGVTAAAHGDAGARGYLRTRDVRVVECGDIGSGEDVDVPAYPGAVSDTSTRRAAAGTPAGCGRPRGAWCTSRSPRRRSTWPARGTGRRPLGRGGGELRGRRP
jgi:nicotine blue oxidoreductase